MLLLVVINRTILMFKFIDYLLFKKFSKKKFYYKFF